MFVLHRTRAAVPRFNLAPYLDHLTVIDLPATLVSSTSPGPVRSSSSDKSNERPESITARFAQLITPAHDIAQSANATLADMPSRSSTGTGTEHIAHIPTTLTNTPTRQAEPQPHRPIYVDGRPSPSQRNAPLFRANRGSKVSGMKRLVLPVEVSTLAAGVLTPAIALSLTGCVLRVLRAHSPANRPGCCRKWPPVDRADR